MPLPTPLPTPSPTPLHVHVLQHEPFEGLGSMAPRLAALGAKIRTTRLYENPVLPVSNEADLLIVLGGSMSVHDEARFPWLHAEKRFLRAAIDAGGAVLGICLGAQLIADVLGARVVRNPVPEIGWFPVEAVPPPVAAAFRFPDRFPAFHWHGETFDLPPGAIHLARSEHCVHQAFQFGERVIGLQFHLETTPEDVQSLIEHCGKELVPGVASIQQAQTMRHLANIHDVINGLMGGVLEYLLRRSGVG